MLQSREIIYVLGIPAQMREKHKLLFLGPHMYKQEPVRTGDVHACAQDVLVGVN